MGGGKAKNWERKEETNEWTDKEGNWERKEDSKKWETNSWDQKHGDASWKEGGSSSSGSWKDGRKEKKESSKPFLPGDWLCPSCNHHNYAKNDKCRQCGADKPWDSGGDYEAKDGAEEEHGQRKGKKGKGKGKGKK